MAWTITAKQVTTPMQSDKNNSAAMCAEKLVSAIMPRSPLQRTLYHKVQWQKFLLFARRLDQGFHLVQVAFQSAPAGSGQTIIGPGHAAFERFLASNVLRFFELAGVYAEV